MLTPGGAFPVSSCCELSFLRGGRPSQRAPVLLLVSGQRRKGLTTTCKCPAIEPWGHHRGPMSNSGIAHDRYEHLRRGNQVPAVPALRRGTRCKAEDVGTSQLGYRGPALPVGPGFKPASPADLGTDPEEGNLRNLRFIQELGRPSSSKCWAKRQVKKGCVGPGRGRGPRSKHSSRCAEAACPAPEKVLEFQG